MPSSVPATGPTRVTVGDEEAERRLDNFLLSRLKGVPRSRIYRMIRGGEVRVNKRRARPGQRLVAGDEVRIPPVRTRARDTAAKPQATDWIEERVIYEDRDLLVLDKPSGLAVHGGSGVSLGAIELLRAARGDSAMLELAHRLDRETSGCLLIAKRRSSLRWLHELFRSGQVDKRYTALLLGTLPEQGQVVETPLTTSHRRGGERHVHVDPAGKKAWTRFTPEQDFRDAVLTTVEIRTGRTHQIRVHAAHIGHPVAGDTRYGPANDPVVHRYGLKRLFLHAASINFESQRGDRIIRVDCPLDEDLQQLLHRLAEPRRR